MLAVWGPMKDKDYSDDTYLSCDTGWMKVIPFLNLLTTTKKWKLKDILKQYLKIDPLLDESSVLNWMQQVLLFQVTTW